MAKRTQSPKDSSTARKRRATTKETVFLPFRTKTRPTFPTAENTLSEQSAAQTNFDPQKQSRLLRLSPEVRLIVYDYAFPQYDFLNSNIEYFLKPLAQPDLARTCRLLRSKALPRFYSRHERVITIHHFDYRLLGTLQDQFCTAPWLQETKNSNIAPTERIVFFTRDIGEALNQAAAFRVSFSNDEPGFEIQHRIWRSTTKFTPLLTLRLHDDTTWAKKRLRVLEEHMETLTKTCKDKTFDESIIEEMASLLLSTDRWRSDFLAEVNRLWP